MNQSLIPYQKNQDDRQVAAKEIDHKSQRCADMTEQYENGSDEKSYFTRRFCMFQRYRKNGVEVVEKLCNFVAMINKEIVYDDGFVESRYYCLACTLADGVVREVTVSSTEFSSLNWVARKLGAKAIIEYNQRRHIPAGIQTLSSKIITVRTYSHVGWRWLDGQWRYLTASGAIGSDGLANQYNVELDGKNRHYAFPRPSRIGSSATQAVLKLLELASPEQSYPLFAAIFLAPLCRFLPVDFSIFLCGTSGSFKSSIAAILQSFYGKEFNARCLPENWSSTDNAIAKNAFIAKDSIFVIDDYCLGNTNSKALESKADRIFRGAGNKAGRQRLIGGALTNQEHYSRGLIIATGETVPSALSTESIQARLFIIEIKWMNVATETLTRLQTDASSGVFALVMSSYIQWLAGHIDAFESIFKNRHRTLTQQRNRSQWHSRTPSNLAFLQIGLESALAFFRLNGTINEKEYDSLYEKGLDALVHAAESHELKIHTSRPEERFLSSLAVLFDAKKVHIVDADTGLTPRINKGLKRWGWIKRNNEYVAQGTQIGWLKGNDLYLDPQIVFKQVQSYCNEREAEPIQSSRKLWQCLYERGYLASHESSRDTYTVRKMIQRARKSVIHLNASSVYPNQPTTSKTSNKENSND